MDETVRRSIILDLVSRLDEAGTTIFMTTLQKLPYFLQEALGVPLGFRFVMHYYGPYSFDLAHCINALAAAGTIDIVRDSAGYGYRVHSCLQAKEILGETESVRARYSGRVERLVSVLGKVSVDDLEILSTSHFVRTLLKENGAQADDEDVAREVHSLKPKFPEAQILSRLPDLGRVTGLLESPLG